MAVRILVVDDAPFIRDMVKKQLRDEIPDLELKDAADGVRALALIKQWSPEIVLSDWEMPNMNGEELLREVRSLPNGATLPFIMITSRGDRDHVVKAVQSGVSDYITKPFTPEELLRKVSKQLKAIGRMPVFGQQKIAAGQNIAFASLDVLTAGRAEIVTKSPAPSANNGSAALLQQNPLLAKKEAPIAAVKTTSKGRAQLRFPNELIYACEIREMSLQLMSCTMTRGNQLPSLFDQTVVDIESGDGESLARVNGYVHAMSASENRPDTQSIKIMIRFVDNDPDKFAVLSKYIAQ
jgi:DNA-binding response OmpR family regulator